MRKSFYIFKYFWFIVLTTSNILYISMSNIFLFFLTIIFAINHLLFSFYITMAPVSWSSLDLLYEKMQVWAFSAILIALPFFSI